MTNALSPDRRDFFGLALGGLEKAAAATRKRNEDERADEIQTNSARHRPTFDEFI